MRDDWVFIVNLDKKIVDFLPFRWYSLLFALGFIIGLALFRRWYQSDKNPYADKIAESYLFYAVIGTLLGARLGHVFFYQWDYFKNHLVEIILPFQVAPFKFTGFAGLASHGGVVGLIIVTIWFLNKYKDKYQLEYASFFDRLFIVGVLTGSLIRIGNFVNGEIVGKLTNANCGFVFLQNFREYANSLGYDILSFGQQSANKIWIELSRQDKLSSLLAFGDENISNLKLLEIYPNSVKIIAQAMLRYPTQLFESVFYLAVFVSALIFYRKLRHIRGLTIGIGLTVVFVFRFIIEFIKENQVAFEQYNVLNQGQKLSIPFILLGALITFLSIKRFKVE